MKINLENPRTALDHFVWWALFLSVGWVSVIVMVAAFGIAYWHDRRLIMRGLRQMDRDYKAKQ